MSNFFINNLFKFDQLSGFVAVAIVLFMILTLSYSFRFMKGRTGILRYYVYVILTAISAVTAVFANNLILLLACWGFVGFTLYLLINMGDEKAPEAAKKTLIIVGGSDAIMMVGLGIIYAFTQTFQMDQVRLGLNSGILIFAYICIAVGSFAKAAVMPFHSWMPDCAKAAPVPVVAYLPASLDKLLGIYLLMRLSLSMFVMSEAMNMFLMAMGAIAIVCAAMMSLIQVNMKRLLAYCAVSQAGYIILGIGTANPIGIAGSLFHMINHAIYKACLFFCAGNIEYRARTTELNKLGNLAKFMPITYITCVIASFSVSGIPPLNGFVSKWLIYQGVILRAHAATSVIKLSFTVFCLLAAMFGSALTLAAFVKLLHAVFLGQRFDAVGLKDIKEVPLTMIIPSVVLAGMCILFGVFAFVLPLKYFVLPVVSAYKYIDMSELLGVWPAVLATLVIVAGIFVGWLIFKIGKLGLSFRKDTAYIGGENRELKEENVITGAEFYNNIEDMGLFSKAYNKAGEGFFDIYQQSKRVVLFTSGALRHLHNGVLPTYLVWMLLGMMGLFLVLIR